ncbi:MAG TPA: hypothetical protein VGS62_02345 [Streptosporangiaceae bacterium]|nr:hypothetical protein [Streptosporangiaceae bacterium]
MDEDEGLWLWKVIEAAGHIECGSWRYDALSGRLVCVCKARLFKAAMVRAT